MKILTKLVAVLAPFFLLLALGFVLTTAVSAREVPESVPKHVATALTPVVLYDGNLGGTPDLQNMSYANYPSSSAVQSFAGNLTTLNTTIFGNGPYAGYSSEPVLQPVMPELDRQNGYRLIYQVNVQSEAHGSTDRAGFSVIALSSDNKGIELGHWANEVWAQHDTTTGAAYFTHGEGATVATNSLISYTLDVVTDTYSLAMNGTTQLSGPLRDYTGYVNPPLDVVYDTPSFVFLGDNTTSAQAQIQLGYVGVITATCRENTAVPVTLAATANNADLDIAWDSHSGNRQYELTQSPTPYTTGPILQTTSELTATLPGILTGPDDYYYRLQAKNCIGLSEAETSTADSANWVGFFRFTLMPGA